MYRNQIGDGVDLNENAGEVEDCLNANKRLIKCMLLYSYEFQQYYLQNSLQWGLMVATIEVKEMLKISTFGFKSCHLLKCVIKLQIC